MNSSTSTPRSSANSSFSPRELKQRTCGNLFHILFAVGRDCGYGSIPVCLVPESREKMCSIHSYSFARIQSLVTTSADTMFGTPVPLFRFSVQDGRGVSKTLNGTLDNIKFLLEVPQCSCAPASEAVAPTSGDGLCLCDLSGIPHSDPSFDSTISSEKAKFLASTKVLNIIML